MDKSLMALKVIGGLLSGGLQGYSTAKKLRQDAALAQLKERPEVAKTFDWIKGAGEGTAPTPEQQRERYQTALNLSAAKSPYITDIPQIEAAGEGAVLPQVTKKSITPKPAPRAPTVTEEFKGASARVQAALNRGQEPDPSDVAIVENYRSGKVKPNPYLEN